MRAASHQSFRRNRGPSLWPPFEPSGCPLPICLGIIMKQRFAIRMVALVLAGICSGLAFADGATNARERFFLKRQNCPWTREMGQFIFEGVKRNDGFNAHWCHNEALDQFCPVDESAAVDAKAAAKAKE